MDMITLAMAKKYTDEKAGYVEIKEANISFDGNVTGKNTIPGDLLGAPTGSVYVHVVSHAVYGKQVKEVGLFINGVITKFEKFTYQEEEGGTLFYQDTPTLEGFPFAAAFRGAVDVADGLYVYCSSDSSVYISAVKGELIQVIHPIDPKFIPGAVLPVVELSTVLVYGETTLTAEESAMLDKATASEMPIVCKCVMNVGAEMAGSYVMHYAMGMLSFMLGATQVSLQRLGEGWVANISSVV